MRSKLVQHCVRQLRAYPGYPVKTPTSSILWLSRCLRRAPQIPPGSRRPVRRRPIAGVWRRPPSDCAVSSPWRDMSSESTSFERNRKPNTIGCGATFELFLGRNFDVSQGNSRSKVTWFGPSVARQRFVGDRRVARPDADQHLHRTCPAKKITVRLGGLMKTATAPARLAYVGPGTPGAEALLHRKPSTPLPFNTRRTRDYYQQHAEDLSPRPRRNG